jgi:hypothetical protein
MFNQAIRYLNLSSFSPKMTFYFAFLSLLLVIEIRLYTTWRDRHDPHTLVFYFTGVQLLIGILPLFWGQNKRFVAAHSWRWWQAGLLSILGIWSIFYAYNLLKPLFDKMPIVVTQSDIIPLIQHMCSEFSAGRFPYTAFDDFGYLVSPTYLPAQWMPFLLAKRLSIDPRMLSFCVFVIAYSVFATKIIQNKVAFLKAIVLLSMPFFLISVVFEHDLGIFTYTIEQLIVAYYLLLGISLTTESRVFQVFTLVLCLMSRFALVFWLPLFIFMVWTKKGLRPTLQLCGGIFLGCALLYGPFLLKDPHIFMNAQAYYDLGAERCWANEVKPTPIYHGLAFTIFFFEKAGDKIRHIAEVKRTLILITPLLSLLLGAIWWRFKDKIDPSLFAICSLKISLAVFFSFIIVPFSYLYLTPIIMSSVVLYRFSSAKLVPTNV